MNSFKQTMPKDHELLLQVWSVVWRAESSASAQQLIKHIRKPMKVHWFPSRVAWRLKLAGGGYGEDMAAVRLPVRKLTPKPTGWQGSSGSDACQEVPMG